MKKMLVLLPLLVAMTGCPRGSNQKNPAKLEAFKSATELKQYLVDQYKNANQTSLLDLLFGGFVLSAPLVDQNDRQENSDGYSRTNLQEAGVDESDLVKTDGTYIYSVNGKRLNIIQAVPAAAMEVVGTLDMDLPAGEMYLLDGKAVVLSSTYCAYDLYEPEPADAGSEPGSDSDDSDVSEYSPWLTNTNTFDIYLVDTTAPAEPTLQKKYSFEGELVTSRMIGSTLYVVSLTYPHTDEVLEPLGVRNTAVEDVLPQYRTTVAGQEIVAPVVDWSNVYHPANPDGYGLITVLTINTTDVNVMPVATGVMANYGVVYASPNALYITSTNYDYYGNDREQTEIHKFDLTGQAATYVASGKVPGWLLNQFSLGEYNGYLRTATTVWTGWSIGEDILDALGEPSVTSLSSREMNCVYVLEQQDDELQVAGKVEDIAPDESIYAARFVGDRGFLVTFKQIDPLFTLDLSDPYEPKVVGELEVPGFSTYIHPLDANHLLTLGKGATDAGSFAWFGSMTLSIYDITNFDSPVLEHQEVIGVRGTGSEALYNHKALTFYEDMIAFPVDMYEGDYTVPGYGEHTFSGLLVYRVSTDDGFTKVGQIAGPEWSSDFYNYSYTAWTRGVFIGDHVYSISNEDAKSAAISDMDTVLKTVPLEDGL